MPTAPESPERIRPAKRGGWPVLASGSGAVSTFPGGLHAA
jgi:hypothetical protein